MGYSSVSFNLDFTKVFCSVLYFSVMKSGWLMNFLILLYRYRMMCLSCVNLGGGKHFKIGFCMLDWTL